MKPTHSIEAYIQEVQNNIRWKRARKIATQDLEQHIQDQFDAYVNQGMDSDPALEEAIKSMGDPQKIGKELGQVALDNFHAHIAGIEYSSKGERKHLNLEESDFNYKDLLKAFKNFGVKGVVVCESPNIEDDAKLLKDYYLSL